MRIAAKAQYGLATMIYFAMHFPTQTKFTVLEVSENLKISKIYLEQVFTQLRLAGIVQATKGGYSLTRPPAGITAYEILVATETSLFDPTPTTVSEHAPHIESVMANSVYSVLDQALKDSLSSITLEQLAEKAIYDSSAGYMYYL